MNLGSVSPEVNSTSQGDCSAVVKETPPLSLQGGGKKAKNKNRNKPYFINSLSGGGWEWESRVGGICKCTKTRELVPLAGVEELWGSWSCLPLVWT